MALRARFLGCFYLTLREAPKLTSFPCNLWLNLLLCVICDPTCFLPYARPQASDPLLRQSSGTPKLESDTNPVGALDDCQTPVCCRRRGARHSRRHLCSPCPSASATHRVARRPTGRTPGVRPTPVTGQRDLGARRDDLRHAVQLGRQHGAPPA